MVFLNYWIVSNTYVRGRSILINQVASGEGGGKCKYNVCYQLSYCVWTFGCRCMKDSNNVIGNLFLKDVLFYVVSVKDKS